MYTNSKERERERDVAYTVVSVFRMIVVEVISIEKEGSHEKEVPMRGERGERERERKSDSSTFLLSFNHTKMAARSLTSLAPCREAGYTPCTWNTQLR